MLALAEALAVSMGGIPYALVGRVPQCPCRETGAPSDAVLKSMRVIIIVLAIGAWTPLPEGNTGRGCLTEQKDVAIRNIRNIRNIPKYPDGQGSGEGVRLRCWIYTCLQLSTPQEVLHQTKGQLEC